MGLKSNFTILDTDDQMRLLKQLIVAANIDEKRWPARLLAGLIDGWKNRALTPDRVPSSDAGAYNNRGTELYAAYQERLQTLNATDFGDLLLHCVTIFQTHPDVLAQYQRWFRYILVDEYQDTNVASICGCGCWRRRTGTSAAWATTTSRSTAGAGPRSATSCGSKRIFPARKVIRLEQNYRSTAAYPCGRLRGDRRERRAGWARRCGPTADVGEKVRLIGHWDGEEEARWIGEEIEAIQRGTRGMRPGGPEPTWRSWCAPATRCAPSRTGS